MIEIVVADVVVRVGADIDHDHLVKSHPGGASGMIPAGVKVFVASHPVDFRKGPDGLLALVREAGSDPFSGALYVFRAKRADRVKIVWWDGTRRGAFTASGWRRRTSAGRGSVSIGFNSTMLSCSLWSMAWTGSGCTP